MGRSTKREIKHLKKDLDPTKNMGLIKTGLMLGGGAYALNRVTKSYEATHQGQQQPAPQQLAQRGAHQPYCNGSCGGSCIPNDGYLHASYCNGACGQSCNGVPAGAAPPQQAQRGASPARSIAAEPAGAAGSSGMPWEQIQQMASSHLAPPQYKR